MKMHSPKKQSTRLFYWGYCLNFYENAFLKFQYFFISKVYSDKTCLPPPFLRHPPPFCHPPLFYGKFLIPPLMAIFWNPYPPPLKKGGGGRTMSDFHWILCLSPATCMWLVDIIGIYPSVYKNMEWKKKLRIKEVIENKVWPIFLNYDG